MPVSIEEFAEQCADVYKELKCVDAKTFLGWAELLRVANPKTRDEIVKAFCSDCTSKWNYEGIMREKGLCIKPEKGWNTVSGLFGQSDSSNLRES
jgi:hypothetical protein